MPLGIFRFLAFGFSSTQYGSLRLNKNPSTYLCGHFWVLRSLASMLLFLYLSEFLKLVLYIMSRGFSCTYWER